MSVASAWLAVRLFGCEVCSILLEKLLGAFFRQIACGKAELHRLLVERERFVEGDAGRAYRLDDFVEAGREPDRMMQR